MNSEYIYSCSKCPRTFKLLEFYEKHVKVHDLKKQHVCDVCGFVYGAARGLEGHLKTHTEEERAAVALRYILKGLITGSVLGLLEDFLGATFMSEQGKSVQ